jgi:hypothetical protein
MITRCVCFNKTFKELKIIYEQNNCQNLSDLKKYATFSEKCKLCLPYINKMIETGLTEFQI